MSGTRRAHDVMWPPPASTGCATPRASASATPRASASASTSSQTSTSRCLRTWARARGLAATDYASLTGHPAVHRYVRACVDELNGRLNRWETIKDVRILDHDLSVEADELTPSMKVKRNVIETKCHALLDSMYQGKS